MAQAGVAKAAGGAAAKQILYLVDSSARISLYSRSLFSLARSNSELHLPEWHASKKATPQGFR